jgi:hypothetical protein
VRILTFFAGWKNLSYYCLVLVHTASGMMGVEEEEKFLNRASHLSVFFFK